MSAIAQTSVNSERSTPEPTRSAHVEVAAFTPTQDEERDAYVRAHPRGTFFHLAGWRRSVSAVFGHQPRDLVARRDGAIVGVLPLMKTRTLRGKTNLVSMPYAVYGGALADDPATEGALVAAAGEMARELNAGHLELRTIDAPAAAELPAALGGLDWVPSELYATFVQELPEEPEAVLASMPKKARAEARKARERHGLELAEGIWYLDDLHGLFMHNKRHLGSPGLPITWFRRLRQEFGNDVVLHLIHRDREPLAAVMSFVWNDDLLAYYAGTAEGADRAYSASNFMYLALREWAVERGMKRFDFGRSRKDSGAFSFKARQGFEATDLNYRFHLVRSKQMPSFTPSNPRTKVLRDTWSKLPLWCARYLTDRLARYLP